MGKKKLKPQALASLSGHIIVVGNEKGGSGKSTTAMHLITALMAMGHSVACIDLDVRQQSLTRYLNNRRQYIETTGKILPMPEHKAFGPEDATNEASQDGRLFSVIRRFATTHDIVVIDTPGNDTGFTRAAHSMADTLITPVNDSFIDLDVLATVEGPMDETDETLRVVRPTQYAEMVWEAKKQRALRKCRPINWIVMRNRLSALDARNKRRVEHVLAELAHRFGFRLVAGFGERVIYRELFLSGLTLIDLGEVAGGDPLTLSHVAARQEVRSLVEALRLPVLEKLRAVG
jgi:chromosome partitioning protein